MQPHHPLRRMIDHCERQRARDIAFWDRMILHFQQTLSVEGSPGPSQGPPHPR